MTNIDIIGSSFTSNKPYLFRAIFEWILDNGGTPHLLIDATGVDVTVPQEHVREGQIVLNAAPEAVQGWLADNEAVSFSARFSGKSQQIYIPMKAVKALYAQENGMGMVFPEEPVVQTEDQISTDERANLSTPIAPQSNKPNPARSKSRQANGKVSHLKIIK